MRGKMLWVETLERRDLLAALWSGSVGEPVQTQERVQVQECVECCQDPVQAQAQTQTQQQDSGGEGPVQNPVQEQAQTQTQQQDGDSAGPVQDPVQERPRPRRRRNSRMAIVTGPSLMQPSKASWPTTPIHFVSAAASRPKTMETSSSNGTARAGRNLGVKESLACCV